MCSVGEVPAEQVVACNIALQQLQVHFSHSCCHAAAANPNPLRPSGADGGEDEGRASRRFEKGGEGFSTGSGSTCRIGDCRNLPSNNNPPPVYCPLRSQELQQELQLVKAQLEEATTTAQQPAPVPEPKQEEAPLVNVPEPAVKAEGERPPLPLALLACSPSLVLAHTHPLCRAGHWHKHCRGCHGQR